MIEMVQKLIVNSSVLRLIATKLIGKFQIGDYEQRVLLGAVHRPNYAYCVYNAAVLAKKLGYQRISVLEFGVAGRNTTLNRFLDHLQ